MVNPSQCNGLILFILILVRPAGLNRFPLAQVSYRRRSLLPVVNLMLAALQYSAALLGAS